MHVIIDQSHRDTIIDLLGIDQHERIVEGSLPRYQHMMVELFLTTMRTPSRQADYV